MRTGIPLENVRQSCEIDGLHSRILDFDPHLSLEDQLSGNDTDLTEMEKQELFWCSNETNEAPTIAETVTLVHQAYRKCKQAAFSSSIKGASYSNMQNNEIWIEQWKYLETNKYQPKNLVKTPKQEEELLSRKKLGGLNDLCIISERSEGLDTVLDRYEGLDERKASGIDIKVQSSMPQTDSVIRKNINQKMAQQQKVKAQIPGSKLIKEKLSLLANKRKMRLRVAEEELQGLTSEVEATQQVLADKHDAMYQLILQVEKRTSMLKEKEQIIKDLSKQVFDIKTHIHAKRRISNKKGHRRASISNSNRSSGNRSSGNISNTGVKRVKFNGKKL